jgi:hypothetical protein
MNVCDQRQGGGRVLNQEKKRLRNQHFSSPSSSGASRQCDRGTDVMIFEILSPKKWRRYCRFFFYKTLLVFQNSDHIIANAKLFAENRRKSHKIEIIRS